MLSKRFSIFILFFLSWWLAGAPLMANSARHFDWRADTISFSNDTVFAYGVDERGNLTMRRKEKPARYAHRCFVLTRAVMQFYQFARFAPELPRVSESEYEKRVRHICRIPVWLSARANRDRIVIPGFANLHDFSRGYEHLLKANLGNWFPTYLRVGNWRMVGPFPRFGQRWAMENIARRLANGEPQVVYITRFPKMNHSVVLFADHRLANGDLRFDIYDPNFPNQKRALFYRAKTETFDFPKCWFWTGGRVNLMRVYLSPFQ